MRLPGTHFTIVERHPPRLSGQNAPKHLANASVSLPHKVKVQVRDVLITGAVTQYSIVART